MDNKTVPVGLIKVVRDYMALLGMDTYLDSLKPKGISLSALTAMLMVFALSEGNSMTACSEWLEDKRVRELFGVKRNVSQRTLNRALETLGVHREGIITTLYGGIKKIYPELKLDVDTDGSAVSMNSKGDLADHGYPRDKNPDGLQAEFVVGMLEDSRIPFYTREFKGNTSDEEQYAVAIPEILGLIDRGDLHAYHSISQRLVEGIALRNEEREQAKEQKGKGKRGRKKKSVPEGVPENRFQLLEINRILGKASWVICDNGGASVYNTDAINEMGHEYLTRKRMNEADMRLVGSGEPVDIEPGLKCWYTTFESSGRTKYIFKSDRLEKEKTEAARRRVAAMIECAKAVLDGEIKPRTLVEVKNNPFLKIDVNVQVQKALVDFSDIDIDAMAEGLKSKYCGFFHLESSFYLPPKEALQKYRKRVAIEQTIRSMKNVTGIKPMRVWTGPSVTGHMVLALLSESVISMVRYEYPEDKVKVTRNGVTTEKSHRPDTKSLCGFLNQLTATFYRDGNGGKRVVLSGVTPQSIGILERLESKTTVPASLDTFFGKEKAVKTA